MTTRFHRLLAKSCDDPIRPPFPATLLGHLDRVSNASDAVLRSTGTEQLIAMGLEPSTWKTRFERIVRVAAALHDLGKANDHFQGMVQGTRSEPQGLRHEWVLYWLCRQPPWREWGPMLFENPADWSITLWAIAGHHPAFRRPSPPGIKPPEGSGFTIKVVADHDDFRAIVAWLEKTLGQPLAVPTKPIEVPLASPTSGAILLLWKWIATDGERFKELCKPCDDLRRLVAAAKACLIAADVAGSIQDCAVGKIESMLAVRPSPEDLEALVRDRLGGEAERPFQTAVASSSHRVTLVRAGCGSGKTIAAYLWGARQHRGRRMYFCYPTTGTATEGFRDYLFDPDSRHPKYGAKLFHSRAQVDSELILDVNHERDEHADPHERRLRADMLEAWMTPIVCCTVDRVIGLMQNERKGLFSWPALAQSAFVFDEIHAYDDKLFGLLLRFLESCCGLPVLLMTASLSEYRRGAILESLRRISSSEAACDDELLREIGGPAELEALPRYHRVATHSPSDLVLAEVARGGRVLWVCNTVDRAMKAAISVKELTPLIYHSRFRYIDRVKRHSAVINAFKQDRRDGVVAICTQVAEMSLDLSATLLVTDLAPVPSMIQRLGRLNRRARPPISGESPPPTMPFCVIEPLDEHDKFYVLPYKLDDYGNWPEQSRAWLQAIGSRDVSQITLASKWQSQNAPHDLSSLACCWLDGGPTTTVDSVRESSSGLTVLLADDAKQVMARASPLAEVAIPMPSPPHKWNWLTWERASGIPIAPTAAIVYDETIGARWEST